MANFELIIFSNPKPVLSTLAHDSGYKIIGRDAIHESGRIGTGFVIPDTVPNGNGVSIIMVFPTGKMPESLRAILWLRTTEMEDKYPWIGKQNAALAVDDLYPQDVPPPVIVVVPPPVVIPSNDPVAIINSVYRNGNYDLKTKDGCGKFTEACGVELHNKHSNKWGHIRKSGAQNQYNGHAVDSLMLLNQVGEIKAGIYDIIFDSESDNAKPAFNLKDIVRPELWYYPA